MINPISDKEYMLLAIAKVVATSSTCQRMRVGTVIAIDNRVVSMGYNGSLGGMQHCTELAFRDATHHHEWARNYEMHAEANAIVFAARHGVKIEGATIFCTHSPCLDCAKLIVQAGIKKVIFEEPYDRENSLDLLREAGVEVKYA